MRRVYLDFNATTPVAPKVAAVMRRTAEELFGNSESDQWAGASLLRCAPNEIAFTDVPQCV
jgi:cysteine desulfurase